MPRKLATIDSLTTLFDESGRPIYAVDAERRIVYCNRALASWLDIDARRIIGRMVEFHSEPAADDDEDREAAPLADLCPPPKALAGEPCVGTLSCMRRGGRLVHRRAEFVPLGVSGTAKEKRRIESEQVTRHAVLVLIAATDMPAQELASELSGEASADELHRTIRRFRRAQAGQYSIESLLGNSLAMQKVRAQLAAAVASGANTLICGPVGSGCGHAARAIHYCAAGGAGTKLLPIDCELLSDDLLRRVMDNLRARGGEATHRLTLLLENLDRMSASHQALLASAILEKVLVARVIATCRRHTPNAALEQEKNEARTSAHDVQEGDGKSARSPGAPMPATIDLALLNAVSTITIELPRLTERLEDLPVLAHYFLEAANQGSSKQIGSLGSDALDLLALYSWPGELAQLRETVTAAHRICASHEISASDLPSIIHRAWHAATYARRHPERIVLDELLASIEKEAIVRALALARGNKSEAAGLLGMTRPKLYRRLVQLGLAGEGGGESPQEQPEFLEGDPIE
jgi:DNA-binding NtrC family response regulator